MASETSPTGNQGEEPNRRRRESKSWRGFRTTEARIVINGIVHAARRILPGRGRKIGEELEATWHGVHEARRDFDLIRLYHDYRKSELSETVDDKTWSDLEMDEVFARVDRTTSAIGRQYLYATMRTYENDISELKRRGAACELLRSHSTLRRAIQKELYPLRHKDVSYLVCFLFEKLPDRPGFGRLVYASSAAFFISLALIPLHAGFLLAAAAMALINLGINTLSGRVIFEYFQEFSHLTTMLSAAVRLGKIVP